MALPVGQLALREGGQGGRPPASEARAVWIRVRRCMASVSLIVRVKHERSGQLDDLDPVRVLAHRQALGRAERAAARRRSGAADALCDSCPAAIRKRPLGSMAKPRGVFSVGVWPSGCSRPRRGVDLEARQRARRALRRVEVAAVGRQVQVGGPGLAGEAGGQRGRALLQLAACRARRPRQTRAAPASSSSSRYTWRCALSQTKWRGPTWRRRSSAADRWATAARSARRSASSRRCRRPGWWPARSGCRRRRGSRARWAPSGSAAGSRRRAVLSMLLTVILCPG